MSYPATVLADSPAGYWRLGEASGTTATDASGHAYDGTYTGAVTLGAAGLLAGDADTAVAFAGGYVSLPTSMYSPVAGDFALEWWIATTSSAFACIWYTGHFGDFRLSGGKVSVSLYGDTERLSAASVNDGSPHHVVIARESGSLKVYIDGVLDTDFGADTSYFFTSVENLVGSDTAGDDYIGTLDEVAFYGAALSAAQVAAHHAAGVGGGGGTAGNASGAAPSLALSAPAGAATGAAFASGAAPALSLAGLAAVATGAADASGLAPSITLAAPAGSASTQQPGNASGVPPALALGSSAAVATGAAAAAGVAPVIALAGAFGGGTGEAVASGTAPALSIGVPARLGAGQLTFVTNFTETAYPLPDWTIVTRYPSR